MLSYCTPLLGLLIAITVAQHFAVAEHVTLGEEQEQMPKMSAQYDYYYGAIRGAQPPFGGGIYGVGQSQAGGHGSGGGAAGGDTVNFDFQCRCQAKSALARTLSNPVADQNQATQQQVQQLQEQVRKLQEQINRAQQGKSSFEQFAQMLSLADGLDCNCAGSSTPWTGWPSGVLGGGLNGSGYPQRGGFGGGQYQGGGGGMPLPPRMPMMPAQMGAGNPFGGGVQQQIYGPMVARQA